MKRFLLTLLLPLSLNAIDHNGRGGTSVQETLEYYGQKYPVVDLRNQFREEIPQQGYTSSCGSFAAVALLEAACRRATHEELDLSEAMAIYRRIKAAMANERFTLETYHFWRSGGLVGTSEASNPNHILDDIKKNGAICRESDLSFDKDFFPFVAKMKGAIAKEYEERAPRPSAQPQVGMPSPADARPTPSVGTPPPPSPPIAPSTALQISAVLPLPPLPPVPPLPPPPVGISILGQSELRPPGLPISQPELEVPPLIEEERKKLLLELKGKICGTLDEGATCHLGQWRSDGLGRVPNIHDPILKACLEKLDDHIVIENATPAQALALLAAGQPFTCGARMIGLHAFVIMGVRPPS